MKKLSIMLMMAFSLCLVSCEDEWVEATPQSNAQEATFTIDGVTVASALPESIELQALNTAGDTIKALNITNVQNLPANSELAFVAQLSDTEDFANYYVLNTWVTDNVVCVSAEDWQTGHLSVFGRSPKAKTAYLRYEAYVVKNTTSSVRLGGESSYVGQTTVSVTPYPSELNIEEAYYLLGTINGWSVATAVKFDHTGDVYDNPVFSISVDISEDEAASGWWWKVIPESTYVTGDWVSAADASFGPAEDGSAELSGLLVGRTDTEDSKAGCLKTAGQMLLTIDMENLSYEFTSAVEYLYTPGDANGWSATASQKLGTTDYSNYYGYAYLSTGGFKFTSAPDWDHTNYGLGDSEGTLSTDGGASNLAPAATGLYWCSVNIAALTYSLTQITTIGLIGDATPGGWDTSTALTPDATMLVWTGTVTLGSGEYKFRANDGWDVNLGGSTDNLEQNGSNIASPGAGTYTVTLDLSNIPYTCTLVAQ